VAPLAKRHARARRLETSSISRAPALGPPLAQVFGAARATLELSVGVGSPVGFLAGDIGVSLGTTDLPLRLSEVAPICTPLLPSAPLATAHRNDYEQDHEDDRDRDYGNDDAGAHSVRLLGQS